MVKQVMNVLSRPSQMELWLVPKGFPWHKHYRNESTTGVGEQPGKGN